MNRRGGGGRAVLWWAKSRAVAVSLAVTLALSVVLALTGDAPVQVPSIIGAIGAEVPLGFFVPLPVIVVFGVGLARPDALLEGRSRRPVRIWDVCLGLLLVLIMVGVWAVNAGDAPLIAARNSAAGIGLTLLAARLMPPSVASLPAVAWILVGVLTGRTSYGEAAAWNWPILDAGSEIGWRWAAMLLVVGASAHMIRSR